MEVLLTPNLIPQDIVLQKSRQPLHVSKDLPIVVLLSAEHQPRCDTNGGPTALQRKKQKKGKQKCALKVYLPESRGRRRANFKKSGLSGVIHNVCLPYVFCS